MKTKALILVLMIACAVPAANAACTTIKEGVLKYQPGYYLAGQPLKPGFDAYGYNYQAHLFNGSYFNVYANGTGFPPYEGDDTAYLANNPEVTNGTLHPTAAWAWQYRSTTVNMKWNDAWISNQDCDGDGLLDRHYGFPSYIGSGAWETNHQSDVTAGVHWTYFVKIVAAPATANAIGGVWQTADGSEIGPVLWDEFAVIQEVYNDPAADAHGLLYKSPTNPGWGFYKP